MTQAHSVQTSEIVTSVRLSVAQHNKLKRVAELERRSVSQQIRYVIDQMVEPGDRKAAA